MKTEFLQNFKIGEQALTKEIIDAILAENGRDIEAAKKPYADYDAIKDRLKTAEDGLKAFEGVDITKLQGEISKLKGDLAKKDSDWQEKIDGMAHGFKPMGDHDDRFVVRQLGNGFQQLLFALGVNIRRRLIENDDGRILQHGAGEGYAHPLPQSTTQRPLGMLPEVCRSTGKLSSEYLNSKSIMTVSCLLVSSA